MTGYAAPNGVSPFAPMVDERQLGSAGGQAMIGVAGIVLAIILVMGQISLATSKGLATHLHASVQHIAKGNELMESVIARAEPTAELQKTLAAQDVTLAHTRDAMIATNQQMSAIAGTTGRLDGIVGRMQRTSSMLAQSVAGMQRSTKGMTTSLGQLPDATSRTHAQLKKINDDNVAVNVELTAIGRKMAAYGLPAAQGAPLG